MKLKEKITQIAKKAVSIICTAGIVITSLAVSPASAVKAEEKNYRITSTKVGGMGVSATFDYTNLDSRDFALALMEKFNSTANMQVTYNKDIYMTLDRLRTYNTPREIPGGCDCTTFGTWLIARVLTEMDKWNSETVKDGSCTADYYAPYRGFNMTELTNISVPATGQITGADASKLRPGDIILYGVADGGNWNQSQAQYRAHHLAVYAGQDANGTHYTYNGGLYAGNGTSVLSVFPIEAQASSGGGVKAPLTQVFHLNMTYNKNITVNLTKTSANLDLTTDNSCYSLAGAVYGVYTSYTNGVLDGKLGELTTDANGHATKNFTVAPSVNTVYVQEITPPQGYLRNDEVITVTLTNNVGNAVSEETPGNDPLRIYLNKISEDGQYVSNPPSLAGAEFTVNFYNAQHSSVEALPAVPTRSWVIKTLQNGTIFSASLDTEHLVSGAPFYYEQGMATLPLGTVTVQETKAPTGYTLDGATYTVNGGTVNQANGIALFNITQKPDGTYGMIGGNEYTVTESALRSGSFSLKKVDADTGSTLQGNATNFSAKFKITNNNDFDAVLRGEGNTVLGTAKAHQDFDYIIQTDDAGNWTSPDGFIPYGSYTITEIEPPVGYVLDSTPQTITVNSDHQVITLDNFEDEVIRGGFKLQKHDVATGTRPQGDGNLQISFDVINKSAGNVVVNGVSYAPDEVVYSSATNEAGYFESEDNLLPYGTYQFIETKAPEGYTIEGETEHTFSITTNGEMSDITTGQIKNRPVLGKVGLHKVYDDGIDSSWSDNEPDAVFGIARKTFVDEYGSVEEALAHQYDVSVDEITDRDWLNKNIFADGNTSVNTNGDGTDETRMTAYEYSIIKTNDTGDAETSDLVYGEYVVKQLAAGDDEINILEEPININIESDGQVIELQASNVPEEYYLRILKKDADTDKTVTLNSAEFKIYQLTDVDGNEVNGYVTQQVGSVTYDTFRTVSDNGNSDLPAGTFYVASEEGGTVVTPLKLQPGTYRVEEVTTPDGYLPIDPVTVDIKNGSITEVDEDGDNFITIEARDKRIKGQLNVYKTIKEIKADTNLLPEDVFQQIEFTLTADKDVIDPADGSVLTTAGSPAKDIYGIEVGIFNLDEKGTGVVENIPIGEYTLRESGIPSGLAENNETWHVSVAEDGDKEIIEISQDVTNIPTSTELSKKEITGDDELPGAEMQIIDKEGKVVDEWISGEEPHVIVGLDRGETYTLVEVASPNDEYAIAIPIEFTVNLDGTVNQVEMRNKQVFVEKYDVEKDVLSGAEFEVIDKNGDVVDKWTTNDKAHAVKNLRVGETYILHETKAPEGYVMAADREFTVEDDDKNMTLIIIDEQFFFEKVDTDDNPLLGAVMQVLDLEGNVVDEWTTNGETYAINNLRAGESYVLHEAKTPARYVTIEDIPFTVEDDGKNESLKAVDQQVVVGKTESDGDIVIGAEFQITDLDGNVIDEWVTDEDPYAVTGLKVGGTYILKETKAPEGYVMAADRQFTVENNNEDLTIAGT